MSAQTNELPPITADDYDIKRIRLFRNSGHISPDILGVTANARELLMRPTFHSFLRKVGHSVRTMAADELAEVPHTDFQVEIYPPLSDEVVNKIGDLITKGFFVHDWAREQLDSPDKFGVLVIDNRRPGTWPKDPNDTAGRVVASSILPAGTRLP